jgi:type IV pilus assembly protein PilM
MPVLSDDELASAIKWEAEQYVPIPLTEVTLDWQVIFRPKTPAPDSKMEVFLVAAPMKVVNKYLKILKMANLRPIAVETDIIAIARSLVGNNPYSPTTLIVNIGASTTDLSIVRVGAIAFTRSIATGGTAFARSIAQDLGFELPQAEEYKKTYGLDETKLESNAGNETGF